MKFDNERVRQYVEDSADLMEEHGLPRMAGRVIGALLICMPRPVFSCEFNWSTQDMTLTLEKGVLQFGYPVQHDCLQQMFQLPRYVVPRINRIAAFHEFMPR